MNQGDLYILRGKIILSISAICIIAAMCFVVAKNTNFKEESYTLAYETYNTKEMATAKVAVKKPKADSIFTSLISNETSTSKFEAVTLENDVTTNKQQQPAATVEQLTVPSKPTWRLPTEQGYITQYESYGHIALDITSARGTNERIYPVADGTISGIFQDNYGAKIVTVNHYIDGRYYTSQYVHLSWYASGIYVGQKVTTDDCIGGMGATGYATGIHLHLTVLDCNLFDPSDPNCSTLNNFYNYGRIRLGQGYTGLRNLMYVPYIWYSR